MAHFFEIKDHVVDGQYIREYPRATANSQEDIVKLAVKQYIPKNNPHPRPGDVTIVASHANGFPKELYEALWEDLVKESANHGFNIRSIFCADTAWQGVSGIMNEGILGNDPSWLDHSRDLLCMINTLKKEMPRPLVGVGHSFGGTIIAELALMHPRLFTSVLLLDPILSSRNFGPATGYGPLALSMNRRDIWPTRAEAAAQFKKSQFYRRWDPRVMDAWITHGLRDTPTAVYPSPDDAGKVTLASTKHMECFTYLRPLKQGEGPDGKRTFDRSKIVDLDGFRNRDLGDAQFYRAEAIYISNRLDALRPGALWIFGADSDVSRPEKIKETVDFTGTGIGGSGGAPLGRVKQHTLEGVGHLVAMDAPGLCAKHMATWLGSELARWREEEKAYESWWKKPQRDKLMLDDEWWDFVSITKRTLKL